jgi:membrane-associated phospholipid phosphatase
MIPISVWAAITAQLRFSRGWSRVLRDWLSLGLILIAYRQVDWFGTKPAIASLQDTWIHWDRFLLDRAGLRAALESFGWLIPSGLELAYLSLYGLPALCLGALYWNGRRKDIDRFLTPLFLGTFCVYALLPHFPTLGPRIAFPGQDLPGYTGLWRSVNLWLLDHCDISTSVFPSGHVAVAFSAAFGLLHAVPDRRGLCAGMFTAAAAVFTATIYCRYHYAVDGLASIFVSALVYLCCEVLDRNA